MKMKTMSKIIVALVIGLILFIPIAAAVPIIVANREEIRAIMIVLKRAERIASLWNSFWYHCKLKPVKYALDFEALNEKTISTSMGMYRKTITNAVIVRETILFIK